MEEKTVKEEKSSEISYIILGLLSLFVMFIGFFGFLYSLGKSGVTVDCNSKGQVSFDFFGDIEKGSTWTNGNSMVVVNRVYKNRVIYTRFNDHGRSMDTCSLSKRVFFDRYSRV